MTIPKEDFLHQQKKGDCSDFISTTGNWLPTNWRHSNICNLKLEEAIVNSFSNDLPRRDWWTEFLMRWRMTKIEFSSKQAEGVSPEVVTAGLGKVKELLEDTGLMKRGRAGKDLSIRMWN